MQAQVDDRNDPAMAGAYTSFMSGDDKGMVDAARTARPGNLPKLAELQERRRANEANNAARLAASAQAAFYRNANQDMTDDRAGQIADAIIEGKQPDMKGLFRYGGPVRANLAAKGYDLATATNEWQAMQKYMASANAPGQIRMAQAVSMIPQQVAKIKDLYGKWTQLAPVSGIKAFNRASLAIAKQTGGEVGALANALEAQIADLTSELGFVYTGGNAPTDHAFKLAGANLSANWDEQSFALAIKNIEDGARYRRNAMGSTGPMGLRENRYSGSPPSAPGAAPAPGPAAPSTDLAKKYGL
jgi:type II secretory pathway pseudopilin PulG